MNDKNPGSNSLTPGSSSRRRWYLWGGVIYAVIIAVVSLGLVRFYLASRDRLDDALGKRLLAVANSVAVMVDGERIFNITVGDSSAASYLDLLEADFRRLSRVGDLAEITLSDPDGVVLFSTSGSLPPGQSHDFWVLDPGAVSVAREGRAAATRLYQLEESYLKSAHAPVIMVDPMSTVGFVVAIVTVSGSPDFFDALATLRRGALVTGAGVLFTLLVLGVILQRLQVSLARYRASVMRQENLATMGRMTAGIAHEIRNPLSIIRGAGQHLQRVLNEAKIQDEVADYIPEEVDRLDHILSGYLAFGGDRKGADEVFDLEAEVARGVKNVAGELAQGRIEIELEPGTDPAPVLGDRLRLQQIVINLLLNARDAMPDGGVVRVRRASAAGRIRFEFLDEGSGLSPTAAEQAFEPFWTSKEKGSGLGLTMSRLIIEEMGGCLELEDRVDRTGARAWFELPLQV